LRGWATTRAKKDTKVAVAHNMGLGGATVVTVLKAPVDAQNGSKAHDGISRLGYNPALSCREITREMLESVRSKRFSEYAMKDTEQPLAKL
jgi:sterol carrier protein 2